MTVEQAGAEFLDACKANGDRESTLCYKRLLIRRLNAFCQSRGLRRLAALNAAETGRFRDSWTQGAAQRYKLQKVLKLFFNWACARRLIDDNPTAKLSQIKVKLRKTEPFTQPQVRAILRAVSDYPGDSETIRAQVLLLRYTGLRGEDAACLRVDAVEGDHITVDTGKTDEVVRIFAPAAAAALRSIRPKTAAYYFWTGEGAKATARSVLYKRLKRLFKLAGMPNAHPHQFRDTFACELLIQGVPIKDVSMMLGHRSVVVTEKYYSKWVRGRQEALDAQVARAMGADQIAKEALAWYGSGTQGDIAEIPVDYKEVVMEPRAGLEPATCCLRNSCSTN